MIIICKKCSEPFSHLVKIDGKERNLCKRKYCLKCSPFKSHNTKKIELIVDGYKKCWTCKNLLPFDKFYVCTRKVGKSFYSCNCKECQVKTNLNKIRECKRKCVEYKGGKCNKCGYCKYLGALEFHHIDPTKKDFTIGNKTMWDFEKLKPELDKCILLCKNCHAEEHGGYS